MKFFQISEILFINGKKQRWLMIRIKSKTWWTESEETKQLDFLKSLSITVSRFQNIFISSKLCNRGMYGLMVYQCSSTVNCEYSVNVWSQISNSCFGNGIPSNIVSLRDNAKNLGQILVHGTRQVPATLSLFQFNPRTLRQLLSVSYRVLCLCSAVTLVKAHVMSYCEAPLQPSFV